MIWVLIVVLTVAVLAVLLRPLLEDQTGYRATHESDMAIYGDQLKELERDRERLLVTEEDYDAAKTEIERRLLEAGRKRRSALVQKKARVPAMIVSLLVPVLALVLYDRMGQPLMPDFPYAARAMPLDSGAQPGGQPQQAGNDAQQQSMEVAAQQLAAKLAQDPNNPEGWALLARSYHSIGDFGQAAIAYRKALEFTPNDSRMYVALGEALLQLSGDKPGTEAMGAFDKALALDGKSPAARYYVGLMSIYRNDKKQALDIWSGLAADSQGSDPWAGELVKRMSALASDLNVDVKDYVPEHLAGLATGAAPVQLPAPVGQPDDRGPTAEDVRDARDMDAGDRAAMIQGMVSQLAERLEENPNDPAGWEKLARAYQVLGDQDKAAYALKRLQEVSQ